MFYFQAWLAGHDKKFGHFINNKWMKPEDRHFIDSIDPASGEVLASTTQGTMDDVNAAVSAAMEAHATWGQLSAHARARHLYR